MERDELRRIMDAKREAHEEIVRLEFVRERTRTPQERLDELESLRLFCADYAPEDREARAEDETRTRAIWNRLRAHHAL